MANEQDQSQEYEIYLKEYQTDVIHSKMIDFDVPTLDCNGLKEVLVSYNYNYKDTKEKEEVNKLVSKNLENIIYYIEDFHNSIKDDVKYKIFFAYKKIFKDYESDDAPYFNILLELDKALTNITNNIIINCANGSIKITDFNQDVIEVIKYFKNEKFFLLRYLTTLETILMKTMDLIGTNLSQLGLKDVLINPIKNPFKKEDEYIHDKAKFEYILNIVIPMFMVRTLSFKNNSQLLFKNKMVIGKGQPLYIEFKNYIERHNVLYFLYSDGTAPQNSKILEVYYNFKNDNFIILL